MTISLQSTLPPGYIPPGVDPKSLDPATQKMVETTGITLEAALKLVGVDIKEGNEGRLDSLLKALLPPPGNDKNGGDPFGNLGAQDVAVDIYSVMALFQRCAQEMRNTARDVRNSEMQAQVTGLMNAAQEIRNAAEDRLQQAIIQGSFQIAGGAASVGMGIAGGIYGAQGISKGVTTQVGMELGNKASALSGMAQGAGTMISGIGTVAGAFKEQEAAEHDARKAEYEAQARVHEQGVQQANDLMQQMMDVIRDVRDKLGAIDQARNETNRAIARNV